MRLGSLPSPAATGVSSRDSVKERRFVARDETKQELNGRRLFVWSAADIESKEFLAIRVSY
jgi:transposase-like protein